MRILLFRLLFMRILFAVLVLLTLFIPVKANVMESPNGLLTLKNEGDTLSLFYKNLPVTKIIPEGLITEKGISNVILDNPEFSGNIKEEYEMITGKKRFCSNEACEYIFRKVDSLKNQADLIVRLYNDGIAFRYRLCGNKNEKIFEEKTSYLIPEGTNRWIMKWRDSYEEFFPKTLTGKDSLNSHWAYPVLTEPTPGVFALISEAGIEKGHAASSLTNKNDPEIYQITFPDTVITGKGEYLTPWRVVIAGDLSTLVESTLITDVSRPSVLNDTDWINPGSVSWIYWAYNHGSSDYDIICRYVDMAEELDLPYMLIDAEWDEMGKDKTVEDAVSYSLCKGIKPMIWYNSTTGWIDGAPGPKYRLNDPDAREQEFDWCENLGIAGVKIDFFSGDSQPTMDYYIDLLESAARHHLLVNFHGATLPRGWQRTYPHLMTTEAVYGAEWYNNKPDLTKRASSHNATLPFTRNIVGSMDYTPCTFSDSQHPHITSKAHELALTVLFESGLQHLADRPESYLSQPEKVKIFLGSLPTVWDETHLIDGYPGEYAVLARRNGNKWYIAGINGTDQPIPLKLKIPSGIQEGKAELFLDEPLNNDWLIKNYNLSELPEKIECMPRGGFVLTLAF